MKPLHKKLLWLLLAAALLCLYLLGSGRVTVQGVRAAFYTSRGDINAGNGEWKRALRLYKKALEIDKDHADATYGRIQAAYALTYEGKAQRLLKATQKQFSPLRQDPRLAALYREKFASVRAAPTPEEVNAAGVNKDTAVILYCPGQAVYYTLAEEGFDHVDYNILIRGGAPDTYPHVRRYTGPIVMPAGQNTVLHTASITAEDQLGDIQKHEYNLGEIVVVFQNPVVEAGVRRYLGKPNSPIRTSDLVGIKTVVVDEGQVKIPKPASSTPDTHAGGPTGAGGQSARQAPKDEWLDGLGTLKDLLLFPNLVNLTISDTQLRVPESFSVVSEISLREIYLEGCNIESLAPLTEIRSLWRITARHLPLGDDGFAPVTRMGQLKHLDAEYCGLTTLPALDEMNSLYHLNVSNNPLRAIAQSGEGAGQNLEYLYISHCEIEDTGPLAVFTALSLLDISHTPLQTGPPLANMQILRTLQADACGLTSLDFVENCAKLEFITAENNQIEQLAPLASLSILSHLYVGGNPLAPEALQHLPARVRLLGLQNTGIQDVSALAVNCPGISSLNLAGNGIQDIAPLAGLPELGWLNIARNQMQNTDVLCSLPALYGLDISENPLAAPPPVGQMPTLSSLHVNGCGLTDLSFLTEARQLWELSLDNNHGLQPETLVPLHVFDLHRLSVANCNLQSAAPLAGFTSLRRLDVSGNPIDDFTPLAPLGQLTHLRAQNTGLHNTAQLSGNTALEELNMANTPATSLAPLAALPGLQVYAYGCPLEEATPPPGVAVDLQPPAPKESSY